MNALEMGSLMRQLRPNEVEPYRNTSPPASKSAIAAEFAAQKNWAVELTNRSYSEKIDIQQIAV